MSDWDRCVTENEISNQLTGIGTSLLGWSVVGISPTNGNEDPALTNRESCDFIKIEGDFILKIKDTQTPKFYVYYYNSSKEFISSDGWKFVEEYSITDNKPNNAVYIRVMIDSTYVSKENLYIFNADTILYHKLDKSEELSGLHQDIHQIDANLGKLIWLGQGWLTDPSNGNVSYNESSARNTTVLIKMEFLNPLKFDAQAAKYYIFFYNSNKEYISSLGWKTGLTYNFSDAPQNSAYCRITIDTSVSNTSDVILEKGLNKMVKDIENDLYGEKIYLTGEFVQKHVNSHGEISSFEGYGSMAFDILDLYSKVNVSTILHNSYVRTWGILNNDTIIAYGELSSDKPTDVVDLRLYNGDTLLVGCADSEQGHAGAQAFYISDNIVQDLDNLKKDDTTQLQKRGDLSNGDKWVLEKDNYVNTFKYLAFSAAITSFSSIQLGHGKNNFHGSYVEIDNTNIIVHNYVTGDSSQTIAHGLNIHDTIQVLIEQEINTAKIRLVSCGESFEHSISWKGQNNEIWVQSFSTLTKCTFGWTCSKYKSCIFMFGDSYFDPTLNRRWVYYLMGDGHSDVFVDALPGRTSHAAYPALLNSLKHGKPKYVVWCLGMNDPDNADSINSSWKMYFDLVKSLCENIGIEMIGATIPSCANADNTEMIQINTFKNAYIRNSGIRYIDFSHAVVKDETTGEWYDGMPLEPGEIHPSVKGAKALYQQAIADFPELMMQ